MFPMINIRVDLAYECVYLRAAFVPPKIFIACVQRDSSCVWQSKSSVFGYLTTTLETDLVLQTYNPTTREAETEEPQNSLNKKILKNQ